MRIGPPSFVLKGIEASVCPKRLIPRRYKPDQVQRVGETASQPSAKIASGTPLERFDT